MKIYFGIDGGTNNGFAIWNATDAKFELIKTYLFWDFIVELGANVKKYLSGGKNELVVVIEDVNRNKPVFWRKGKDGKRLGELEMLKIAQNVGGVKMVTRMITEYCERNNLRIVLIPPTKKSATKINAEKFFKITGYDKQTNEHGRDAAMLVFGRK
jgi:hypothetical protein